MDAAFYAIAGLIDVLVNVVLKLLIQCRFFCCTMKLDADVSGLLHRNCNWYKQLGTLEVTKCMALSKALRRLDARQNSPDDRLYAIEQRTGARSYVIMSPGLAWDKTTDPGPKHLYEVLSGPCNMYLDVEWMTPTELASAEQQARIDQIIAHVCKELQVSYNEQAPAVTVVSASGWKPRGEYKCSWHIHIACARVCWANSLAVGQFVRSRCADITEVDKIPYSTLGQNWRCVGSAKASEPLRRFEPVTRDAFMACTVQHPVAGRALIYPDAQPLLLVETPVPPVIAALAESLHAGGTARMISDDRCVVPFTERQFCEHAGRLHRSNHQYAVIHTQTLMWKMACHACPDALGTWRPFADQGLVAAAFQEQCAQRTGPYAPLPMVACRAPSCTVTRYDLRSIGPPRHAMQHVACRDAIYCISNE